jgi:hypothetical protein
MVDEEKRIYDFQTGVPASAWSSDSGILSGCRPKMMSDEDMRRHIDENMQPTIAKVAAAAGA